MRILALSSWWPEPADNGSRMRIAQLLRALAREHEVHLVALAQGPVTDAQRERLAQVCATVRDVPQRVWSPRRAEQIASLWLPEPASVRATYSAEFAEQVQRRASAVRPDLVIAFQIAAAPYARLIGGVPRVLEEVEVAYLLEQYTGRRGLRRLRSWLTWRKHRRYLAELRCHFDLSTVVSERERALLTAHVAAGRVAVLPNGADVRGCDGAWGAPEPDTLIYPGALSFEANYDAVAHFLASIFPLIRASRPGVRLRITGRSTPEQRAALPLAEGVEFSGYVPDIRPAVAQAWAEVVPLRIGGGTRLKVLEALALGTPVVSTAKGVEGLEIQDGRHALVADSPADFAAATLRLLGEPELRAQISAAGQRLVRERYDWEAIGRRLVDLVREVGGQRGGAYGYSSA